ncbi:type IV secretion protein Rhs [Brenneria tiliae]|uniref:Type IV secretion protein Rhs n=1 Tax=Brenneria tiliae TaxID=2914984 RepID=A0ABT0MWL0_9GAMM|nr:type IV secretion protein Rhs [Brenneria tiliae]MCL2893987.1 type IV secretion protein Rhs [Brenneria tiliae]MCL2896485.1 type IV secretion protein Rhs [Brenneria tiliae]MCL2900986.1 type IV secretion protein Rhs [Brenneria tiliae]
MAQGVKEGTLRQLTIGEIALARQVFGNSIAYHKVWIHCDSYLPFGLQPANTAMAPNGELWFRKELYKPDFSMAYIYAQHTFIHEMAHVWQHQKGMWVRSRGLFSWAADYNYRLDGKKLLNDYQMEQQAQIIADYFFLKKQGYYAWLRAIGSTVTFQGVTNNNIDSLYEYALSLFFKQR